MKKLFVLFLVAIASLLYAETLSAQHNFGVIGGVTFSQTKVKEFNRGTMTQYHAGLTYRAKLPLGFSIQPSLIYQVKGAKSVNSGVDSNTKIGYLELPVSFQWGPDLILFRPFLDVTPFVGYGLNNKFWSQASGSVSNSWGGLNRWEYGVGAGIGLDIWKFQAIARYNWNLGMISKDASLSNIAETFKDGKNFGGVTLSVAFLF
jgi:hypothetical protein